VPFSGSQIMISRPRACCCSQQVRVRCNLGSAVAPALGALMIFVSESVISMADPSSMNWAACAGLVRLPGRALGRGTLNAPANGLVTFDAPKTLTRSSIALSDDGLGWKVS
jgi:hypothetical protein